MNIEEKAMKFYMESITEAEKKDPEAMFIAGCGWKESIIVAALTKYVKETSGDYREFQAILHSLVDNNAMKEEDYAGYVMMAGVLKVFDSGHDYDGHLTPTSLYFWEDENEDE